MARETRDQRKEREAKLAEASAVTALRKELTELASAVVLDSARSWWDMRDEGEQGLQPLAYELRDWIAKRERLVETMRQLASNLTREADVLATGYGHVNGLGIIQSRGSDVDVQCGVLEALRDSLSRHLRRANCLAPEMSGHTVAQFKDAVDLAAHAQTFAPGAHPDSLDQAMWFATTGGGPLARTFSAGTESALLQQIISYVKQVMFERRAGVA